MCSIITHEHSLLEYEYEYIHNKINPTICTIRNLPSSSGLCLIWSLPVIIFYVEQFCFVLSSPVAGLINVQNNFQGAFVSNNKYI